MHDGNRGDGTAHLGFWGYTIALLLSCLIVAGLAYSQGRETERRHEAPKQHAESAQTYAQRACVGLEPGATFECVNDAIEASAETARAEQDLDAQQWMAFWALLMVIVSAVTVAITAVGVVFVKRTLDATLKAVEDTSKATAAMQEANDIARNSFETASRPWLIPRIEGDYLQFNKTNFELQIGAYRDIDANVWIENYGDMPATIIKCEAFLIGEGAIRQPGEDVLHVLTKGEKFFLDQSQGKLAELARKYTMLRKIPFGAFVVTEDFVRSGVHDPPKIVCRIEYLDPAGNTRELGFAFRPSAAWTNDFKRWGGERYNYDRKLRAPQDK